MFATDDAAQIVGRKIPIIKQCIRESMADPEMQVLVNTIFRSIPKEQMINRLWQYQSRLRYVEEPPNQDYCKHAIEFHKDGQGDCEDFVVFNATVLKLLGFSVRLKVADTFGEGYYRHILLEIYDPNQLRWVPFDGTFRQNGLGGEPYIYNGRVRRYAI